METTMLNISDYKEIDPCNYIAAQFIEILGNSKPAKSQIDFVCNKILFGIGHNRIFCQRNNGW